MNWTRGILAAGAVVSTLVVIACSSSSKDGDETNSDQGPVTSVDGNKQLNELSDADAETYCYDTRKYLQKSLTASDHKGLRCNYRGINNGRDEETVEQAKKACTETRNTCMAAATPDAGEGPVDGGGPGAEACLTFKSKVKKCNALTVANSNGCFAEFMKRSKALATSDACVNVAPGSPSDPVVVDIPPVCDAWKACVLESDG